MLILKKIFLCVMLLLILPQSFAVDEEKKFTGTGVFLGHGRGCYGGLYIRNKTIEWNTPFNVCHKTKYMIIEKDLNSNTPHIAFVLTKQKPCPFEVIELVFYPQFPVYWTVNGFLTRKDFSIRKYINWEPDTAKLSCSAMRIK